MAKNLKFLLVIFGILLAVSLGMAAETKIGYIDSQRIFAEYKGAIEIQKQFDKEVENWRREAREKKKEIDNLKDELAKQTLMLSEEKRKERADLIRTKENEYERYIQEIFGPKGKLEQRNAELTKPIADKINVILEKIGTEENYDLILDAVEGGIAYAPKKMDLTDRVIEELNRESGYVPAKGAKLKMAIFYFTETTPEAEKLKLGRTVAESFFFQFNRSVRFQPIPKDTIENILKEKGLDKPGVLTLEKTLEIGRDYGAEVILWGEVRKLEQEIEIEAKIFEVASQRQILSEIGKTKGEKEIQVIVEEIASKLVRRYP